MKCQARRNYPQRSRREDGAILMLDLIVGIFILLIAVMPIGYSFYVEGRAFRAEYQHGVAMEIVDGEMEVLAAGEWKTFTDGSQPYTVHAHAAANLPPGHFQLIKNGNHLRLEWRPDSRNGTASLVREVVAK